MISKDKVRGSEEASKPLIISKNTVYVHTNIEKLDDNIYQYDEIQYTKDEYIELMVNKNNELENNLINTQLALLDIYELLEVNK